tara:strand:- start:5002 stop:7746 length:2745 start_codon:yes stop_codon:yes gene_type:complete
MKKAGAQAAVAAGAAAYLAGTVTLASVKAAENKWHSWLYNRPDKQNFFLLITNVLYLAVTLTVLVLTVLVVQEHVDDLKRNEYTQHRDATTGEVQQYPPCGMPTPDAMYLLQAIGTLPVAGWDGASLEPNYKEWMKRVDRALCSRIVPGKEVPNYDDDMSVCEDASKYVDYGTDHAEELLAIGYLMDDATITPTLEDIDVQEDITAKQELFERRTCLVKKEDPDHPGEKPYYSEQQRQAYGDLKTRVARAYIAAMPAFSRYQKERDTCAVPEQYKDPFDSFCRHSCHVRKELKAASKQQDLMYDTVTGTNGATMPRGTTFTKQLYRLLALSLAGYYDRYHNQGVCFRNTEVDADGDPVGALEFCENSMQPSGVGDTPGLKNKEAIDAYSSQNEQIEQDQQCGDKRYPPPSPAPPIYRNDPLEGVGDRLSAQVCAAILQYGLFEQGRLFGIPDVLSPFVVDNRVDRSLHFLAKTIYDAMYLKPVKKVGDILADPKSKLEMYIAYRLSSTSIWAILVANVAGYMMVRALAPTIVQALMFLGFTTNVRVEGDKTGDAYKEIVLVRPQVGWPVYLAMGVMVLAVYWILWVDPATQSHYYVTPTCQDWQGLGVHVPSGAFGTTWGKRRYGRFGEHIIGVLLAILFVLMLIVIAIGRTFVPRAAKEDANEVDLGQTARIDSVALMMIGLALIVQILFISQSIVSGDQWYETVKASDNDAKVLDVFTKDVWMSIWAAFWTSSSIGWYRQKWAFDDLKLIPQLAFMASCLVLQNMPLFQSAVLLEKEIDAAFSDGKGTTDTSRLIIYIIIYAFSGIWTLVLAIRLKAMWDAMPARGGATANDPDKVARAKEKRRQFIQGVQAAAEQKKQEAFAKAAFGKEGFLAPASRFKIDLSSVRVNPAEMPVMYGSKTRVAYVPLMPKR